MDACKLSFCSIYVVLLTLSLFPFSSRTKRGSAVTARTPPTCETRSLKHNTLTLTWHLVLRPPASDPERRLVASHRMTKSYGQAFIVFVLKVGGGRCSSNRDTPTVHTTLLLVVYSRW
ncbi:hypothetical protein BDQ17DRAFT_905101 [Cyathus striatus]|nr:hypothetical protein BDQ17DRAFT_905101 [Cyathus striatus]